MQATKTRAAARSGILYLRTDELQPNPVQPRTVFDEDSLAELAESIRSYGILHPLTVRRRAGRYELVAGERRLRAARLAGLREVPCVLMDVNMEDAGLIALIENLQRRDLDFLEEANGIRQLIRMFGMSQEEAARRLGKSQSAVANKLRILKLPEDLLETLRERGLSERHARALLRLPDDESRRAALRGGKAQLRHARSAPVPQQRHAQSRADAPGRRRRRHAEARDPRGADPHDLHPQGKRIVVFSL